MSRANKPVIPVSAQELAYGLTLREHFAGLAMQGLCANPDIAGSIDEVASAAVLMANALITELEKDA